jgi:hypothetical protein
VLSTNPTPSWIVSTVISINEEVFLAVSAARLERFLTSSGDNGKSGSGFTCTSSLYCGIQCYPISLKGSYTPNGHNLRFP